MLHVEYINSSFIIIHSIVGLTTPISGYGCFLFFKANSHEAMTMRNILETYEGTCGQTINYQKFEIFCSHDTTQHDKDVIGSILGARRSLLQKKCFKLLSKISRREKENFCIISMEKINLMSSKCLSKTGQ